MNLADLYVPEGWSQDTVANACEIHNHLREPISLEVRKTMQGEYPYYGPTGILDYLDHYQVDGKYALIGEDGDHFLKYVSRSMTLLVEGKFNVNNHAHLVTGGDSCSTEWFYHFFRHTSVYPFLSRQGAGRYKLNKATLEKLPILLPPLPEQRAIADILSTWDEAIAIVEMLIAAVGHLKKGLMQQLLTGQTRFPEFDGEATQHTKFGEIPGDWELVVLGDISEINAESLTENGDPGHEYFYIDLSSVREGIIDFPKVKQKFSELPSRARRVLHEGDVIMATVRPNLRGFALCDFDPENVICSTGFALISAHDLADSPFIYQLLYIEMISSQLDALVTGSNYPAVNSSEVKMLKIFYPNLRDERVRIADVLQSCDEEVKILSEKQVLLQEQKKGLMQQLLTGQIRVGV